MRIAVVDPLEVVDVDQRGHDRNAVAPAALEGLGEPRIELAAIGQPGERIAARLALEGLGLLAQALQQGGLVAIGLAQALGLRLEVAGPRLDLGAELDLARAQLRGAPAESARH